MSENARKVFEGLNVAKNAVRDAAPGLSNFFSDIKAEFKRLGTQGCMELASALFGEKAFVPYGPGQYTPSVEHGKDQEMERGR